MSKKIANTKRSGLSVARVDRNRLDALYYQLIDLVKGSGLGEEYVNFFARPKDVSSEKSIDWYSDIDGEPHALSSLPDEEADAAYGRFASMVRNLLAYSDKLRDSGEKSSADLLKSALSVPDRNYIYVICDQIVLTCWGFSQTGESRAKDGDITASVQEKPVEKAVSSLSAQEKQEEKREESLTDVVQEEPDRPEEKEQVQEESSERVEKKKSGIWPVLLFLLLALIIAALAWYFLGQNKEPKEDLSFLKGEMNVSGVLANENGDHVDLMLFFPSDDGKGASKVISARQECTGTVSAHLKGDDKVIMHLTPLVCPDNNNFSAIALECKRDGTQCVGTNEDGSTWNITPTRK